ncbi:hypothetical protein MtrunA17_Chr3g0135601 [Medicago truncatula]|uniref:Uncharacterized protein n=1 Tax=Medicago truncatula TaxID=3880 RepID=A0A072VCL5_MEDTR|nr:hypothetical protein MTR_3g104215 [Medicago truncatula]RHN70446.1 hypothetical protein MtrunA17_Chr3g0135601 [Medicago truncatula]
METHHVKILHSRTGDLTTDKGTLVIAVLFATKVVKDFIYSMSSSNLLIFKQPERMRVFRDFNLYVLLGRLHRLIQSSKFIRRILSRCPMLGEISDNIGQSLSTSFSRLGMFEKSRLRVR